MGKPGKSKVGEKRLGAGAAVELGEEEGKLRYAEDKGGKKINDAGSHTGQGHNA